MLAAAIAALIGSALWAYLIGYALAARRDSFLRTKRGILLLVVGGVSLIPLPPQMTALDDATGSLVGVLGDAGAALTWPAVIGKGVYTGLWIATTVAAFLVGIRIWQLGTVEWRGGTGRAVDSSAASRVIGLIPLADRIEDVLETVGRAGLAERDIERVAEPVRAAGRRFADSLPPSDGEAYRLVASRVSPAIAGRITGLLLEGAGRRTTHG